MDDLAWSVSWAPQSSLIAGREQVMRLCHLLQQDSGGSLSNGGKEGRRQRARRPVFEDRWQKKGVLVGRCGAALVGVEVKNAFPEGGRHLDFCPCLQIGSVQQAKGRPYPLHTSYETLGTYAPSKIHADIHINPPLRPLYTPLLHPVCCF